MFKFEEICELVRLVGSTQVACLEIERAGSRLRIEGPHRVAAGPAAVHPTVPVAQLPVDMGRPAVPLTGAPQVPDVTEDEESGLHYVTSPIVGTFYRAPNPRRPAVRQGRGLRGTRPGAVHPSRR